MWMVVAPAALRPTRESTMDDLRTVAAELIADWHPSLTELVQLGNPASIHSTMVRTANRCHTGWMFSRPYLRKS